LNYNKEDNPASSEEDESTIRNIRAWLRQGRHAVVSTETKIGKTLSS